MIDQPIGRSAELGDTLTLSCKSSAAPTGVTPTTYWQQDGGSLQSAVLSNIISDESGVTSYLTFFSVTSSMDGSYNCFIDFDGNTIQSDAAVLSIEGIKSFPPSARGVIGNGVAVTCVGSGDSYASDVVWYKDGADVTTIGLGSLAQAGIGTNFTIYGKPTIKYIYLMVGFSLVIFFG